MGRRKLKGGRCHPSLLLTWKEKVAAKKIVQERKQIQNFEEAAGPGIHLRELEKLMAAQE